MKGVLFVVLSGLMAFSFTHAAAQVFSTPTPTPSPRQTPAPTPEPRPVPCPGINIQAQGGQRVRDGQAVSFALNIGGGDPRVQPSILWSTNAGLIKQGQGTRRIDVDTTGAGEASDRELRADVWVGGYAPECVLQASAKIQIIPRAVKFGEFGEVDARTFDRNLDALAAYLERSPDNLYLIGYAGRKNERGFTATWIRRIREALVTDGISPRRVFGIDGGFREEPLFDFWIVASGAEPPRPAPTVGRDEIVYPKPPPKRSPGS